jgi:hypothetical protein
MTKTPEQPMSDWIAEVNRIAFQLEEIGVNVSDEDKILVLTQGLPEEYRQFIITLDATPSTQLTIDDVTSRLINEESHHVNVPDAPDGAYNAITTLRNHTPLERITCFHCGKKGHYQSNCPMSSSTQKSTPSTPTGASHHSTPSAHAVFVEDDVTVGSW